MGYGDGAVPLDHADLDENTCLVWSDEHGHGVILDEMSDWEAECVEHRLIPDSMPVGTCQDNGL